MTTNIFNRLMTSLNRVTLQAAEQNGDNIKTITIGQFVSPEYQTNYAQQIAQIRALCPTLEDKIKNEDRVKQLKVRLPAGIISGVAADGIGQDNIVERNGVISIDIDAKDNPDIHDWEALKRDLASLPFVAYAGISVSGLGVFALRLPRPPLCRLWSEAGPCSPEHLLQAIRQLRPRARVEHRGRGL